MTIVFKALASRILNAFRDLAPIIVVIAFFQIVVLQQPFPNLGETLVGLLCVVLGLALFIHGLESGLFPLGEAIAQAFAKKSSVVALLSFAFCLGFGTTVAEPALMAVASEAANVVAQSGHIADSESVRASYALSLRIVVALSVGTAVVIGVFRILKGWPHSCHDHFGIRDRDLPYVFRTSRNHRNRLRLGRCNDKHYYRAFAHSSRCGPSLQHQRT